MRIGTSLTSLQSPDMTRPMLPIASTKRLPKVWGMPDRIVRKLSLSAKKRNRNYVFRQLNPFGENKVGLGPAKGFGMPKTAEYGFHAGHVPCDQGLSKLGSLTSEKGLKKLKENQELVKEAYAKGMTGSQLHLSESEILQRIEFGSAIKNRLDIEELTSQNVMSDHSRLFIVEDEAGLWHLQKLKPDIGIWSLLCGHTNPIQYRVSYLTGHGNSKDVAIQYGQQILQGSLTPQWEPLLVLCKDGKPLVPDFDVLTFAKPIEDLALDRLDKTPIHPDMERSLNHFSKLPLEAQVDQLLCLASRQPASFALEENLLSAEQSSRNLGRSLSSIFPCDFSETCSTPKVKDQQNQDSLTEKANLFINHEFNREDLIELTDQERSYLYKHGLFNLEIKDFGNASPETQQWIQDINEDMNEPYPCVLHSIAASSPKPDEDPCVAFLHDGRVLLLNGVDDLANLAVSLNQEGYYLSLHPEWQSTSIAKKNRVDEYEAKSTPIKNIMERKLHEQEMLRKISISLPSPQGREGSLTPDQIEGFLNPKQFSEIISTPTSESSFEKDRQYSRIRTRTLTPGSFNSIDLEIISEGTETSKVDQLSWHIDFIRRVRRLFKR